MNNLKSVIKSYASPICKRLGITQKALQNRTHGTTPFSHNERVIVVEYLNKEREDIRAITGEYPFATLTTKAFDRTDWKQKVATITAPQKTLRNRRRARQ